MFRKSAVHTAVLLGCATLGAGAGEYARDPCAPPASLKGSAGALFARYDVLANASRRLDVQGKDHDTQCDRELPKGSPAEVACGASKLKLAGAISDHDQAVEDYRKDVGKALEQSLARIQERMVQTRARLAGTAPAAESWTHDMEEWIELGNEARREARWTAYEKTAGLAIEGVKTALEARISIAESARSSFGAWFAAAGPALPAGAHASVEAQVRNLRSGRDVVRMLDYLYEQHSRAYSVAVPLQAGHNWEASGKAVAGALRVSLIVLQNAGPEARLAVDIAELLVEDGYGWLARVSAVRRVEQFAALQEQQLQAVKALTKLYAADVDARKALLGARQRLASDACR